MVTFRLEDTSEKTVCGVTSIQEKLRVFGLHFKVLGSSFQVLFEFSEFSRIYFVNFTLPLE